MRATLAKAVLVGATQYRKHRTAPRRKARPAGVAGQKISPARAGHTLRFMTRIKLATSRPLRLARTSKAHRFSYHQAKHRNSGDRVRRLSVRPSQVSVAFLVVPLHRRLSLCRADWHRRDALDSPGTALVEATVDPDEEPTKPKQLKVFTSRIEQASRVTCVRWIAVSVKKKA